MRNPIEFMGRSPIYRKIGIIKFGIFIKLNNEKDVSFSTIEDNVIASTELFFSSFFTSLAKDSFSTLKDLHSIGWRKRNSGPFFHNSLKISKGCVWKSAGFSLPFTWNHCSLSTTLRIFSILFSTHGFQHFSFPLIQHNAISELVQQ